MRKGIHISLAGDGWLSVYWNYRPDNKAIGDWFLSTEGRAPYMFGLSIGWTFVGVQVFKKETI